MADAAPAGVGSAGPVAMRPKGWLAGWRRKSPRVGTPTSGSNSGPRTSPLSASAPSRRGSPVHATGGKVKDKLRDAVVYFVEAEGLDRIKIGTATDIEKRFAELRTMSPVPLKLLAAVQGGVPVEQALHDRFAADRLHGEWFRASADLRSLIRDITRVVT
jgi:hypothetical protein